MILILCGKIEWKLIKIKGESKKIICKNNSNNKINRMKKTICNIFLISLVLLATGTRAAVLGIDFGS